MHGVARGAPVAAGEDLPARGETLGEQRGEGVDRLERRRVSGEALEGCESGGNGRGGRTGHMAILRRWGGFPACARREGCRTSAWRRGKEAADAADRET